MPSVPPVDDLEAAWNELHEANATLRRFVGQPAFNEYKVPPWEQYAFDSAEKPKVGHRSRVDGPGHDRDSCVREMARCWRSPRGV